LDLGIVDDDDDGSGGDDDGSDDNIIIIIIIIIIGSAIGFTGFAYTKSKKGKQTRTTDSEIKVVEQSLPRSQIKIDGKSISIDKGIKPKKKKKMSSVEVPTKTGISDEEKMELEMTASEVDVQKSKIMCLVHRGDIVGDIYVCPNCQSFYCQRCARILKTKEENCWTCNNEITVALIESEKESTLTFNSVDILKEIIESDPLLGKVIKKNKDIKDIAELYNYDLLAIDPNELNRIDKLDLTMQEKTEIVSEYIMLKEDDRKEMLDILAPELTSAFELSPEFEEIYQNTKSQLSSLNSQIKDLDSSFKAGEFSEAEYIKRNVALSEKRSELKELKDQLYKQKIIILDSEIESLQKKIEEYNRTYIAGAISQEDYLKEKSIMAEKLGTLMGKRDLLED
jgi:hypothetical protein